MSTLSGWDGVEAGLFIACRCACTLAGTAFVPDTLQVSQHLPTVCRTDTRAQVASALARPCKHIGGIQPQQQQSLRRASEVGKLIKLHIPGHDGSGHVQSGQGIRGRVLVRLAADTCAQAVSISRVGVGTEQVAFVHRRTNMARLRCAPAKAVKTVCSMRTDSTGQTRYAAMQDLVPLRHY